MNTQTLIAVADYLETPSVNETEDYNRRKDLYQLLGLTCNTGKYLSGQLGESIVKLYYQILNQSFTNKPTPVVQEELGKTYRVYPDGAVTDSFYVEVKMRQYYSNGTSHEKIQSIAWKYRNVGKKIKLFLLGDDEHKYNQYWTQLIRGTIEPENPMEIYQKMSISEVIDEIILGTEIAKVLKEYAETTVEMGG